MKGSMNMSYDSANLTTPDIKWLGVRPSDLERFSIPQQCRIKMTEEDMKTGRKLVRSAAASIFRAPLLTRLGAACLGLHLLLLLLHSTYFVCCIMAWLMN